MGVEGMFLMIGTLGHYSLSALLGKGGMGVVFRAKDQKLGRGVAIKVLPEEFARDTERVTRFQREAKLLASLNHPNIAAIYGLEESRRRLDAGWEKAGILGRAGRGGKHLLAGGGWFWHS
jgi:predicted Ser/Thr protein kinase